MNSHSEPSSITDLGLSDKAQALVTGELLWQARFFAQVLQEAIDSYTEVTGSTADSTKSGGVYQEEDNDPAVWGSKYAGDMVNISTDLVSALQQGFGAVGGDYSSQVEQCKNLVAHANDIGVIYFRLLKMLEKLESVLSNPEMVEPYLIRFEDPTKHLINELDNLPRNLNIAIREFEAMPEESRPANLPLNFQFPDWDF